MPMNKSGFRSLGLPLLVIPIGGLIMIALTLVMYLELYLLLESLFFSNNPQAFPAGALRAGSTIALVGLYLVLLRTKLPELLKAINLSGPLAALIITTGHALSTQPVVSVAAMFVVVAICGILLYRYRKPWIYYYAGAIAALVGLVYAWPNPGAY
jgi:hypothetical protein